MDDSGRLNRQPLSGGTTRCRVPALCVAVLRDTGLVRPMLPRHRVLVTAVLAWLFVAGLILLFHYLDYSGPAVAV